MNALPCRLVSAAVLLAVLTAAPVPAAAQAQDPSARLAQEAAERWAKGLLNSLYFRAELPPETRKRLALEPFDPLQFGLSDRHRWQLYDWMLAGLQRADPRYKVVDRARIAEIYQTMKEADVADLDARYREVLKSAATRINVVCRGKPHGQWIMLDCAAKDIDTGHRLGGDVASFNMDWLPLVRLDYALGAVAGKIVSRLSRPVVVVEVRVHDQVRENDPALVEYVKRSLGSAMVRQMRSRRGWSPRGTDTGRSRYELEASLVPFDQNRLVLDVMVFVAGNPVPVDSEREDVSVASLPVASTATPAPGPASGGGSNLSVVLDDGTTLADWVLLAEERMSRGDHTRLLTEANRHIREHGAMEMVVAVRERAVAGLVEAIRVETRDDAPAALKSIARIEAAVGPRPALLGLRAKAHRLLGDYSAEESAHVAWLRAAPQDHPRRREVLSDLARVREWLPQHKRFAELLGRPFSKDSDEGGVGWTDLHYAAVLDLAGVIAALVDPGMAVDTRLKSDHSLFGDDLKRTLAALGHERFKRWAADGETPLMIAVDANARGAVEYLIERGANIRAKASRGATVLHFVRYPDARELVEYLVNEGADVNAKNGGGTTPLHNAAGGGRSDVVEYLVSKGADVNAKNGGGTTPLHNAAQSGRSDVVEYLVSKGADVNAKNGGARHRCTTRRRAAGLTLWSIWSVRGRTLTQGPTGVTRCCTMRDMGASR